MVCCGAALEDVLSAPLAALEFKTADIPRRADISAKSTRKDVAAYKRPVAGCRLPAARRWAPSSERSMTETRDVPPHPRPVAAAATASSRLVHWHYRAGRPAVSIHWWPAVRADRRRTFTVIVNTRRRRRLRENVISGVIVVVRPGRSARSPIAAGRTDGRAVDRQPWRVAAAGGPARWTC